MESLEQASPAAQFTLGRGAVSSVKRNGDSHALACPVRREDAPRYLLNLFREVPCVPWFQCIVIFHIVGNESPGVIL